MNVLFAQISLVGTGEFFGQPANGLQTNVSQPQISRMNRHAPSFPAGWRSSGDLQSTLKKK
jgi:hypothetical protein